MAPLNFPGLTYTTSVQQSKHINDAKGPMVVISANGMCTGGRILHHLSHNLPDPNAHIVIVGYQGTGTLGRRLVDGAKEVSIFGHHLPVRAAVHTLGGFSGVCRPDWPVELGRTISEVETENVPYSRRRHAALCAAGPA